MMVFVFLVFPVAELAVQTVLPQEILNKKPRRLIQNIACFYIFANREMIFR